MHAEFCAGGELWEYLWVREKKGLSPGAPIFMQIFFLLPANGAERAGSVPPVQGAPGTPHLRAAHVSPRLSAQGSPCYLF